MGKEGDEGVVKGRERGWRRREGGRKGKKSLGLGEGET